jgi:DNA polymerase I
MTGEGGLIVTRMIQTVNDLEEYAKYYDTSNINVFDTETTGLRKDSELLGVSVYDVTRHPVFIFIDTPYFKGVPIGEFRRIMNPIFSKGEWMGHNAKFDEGVFFYNKIHIPNVTNDTIVLIHLADNELMKNLETRLKEDFGYAKPKFKEIVGKTWDKIDWLRDTAPWTDKKGRLVPTLIKPEMLSQYAAEDVYWTYKLYCRYYPKVAREPKLLKIYEEIEMPLVHILRGMQAKGVKIDTSVLDRLRVKAIDEMADMKNQIFKTCKAEFNLGSPKQLGEILYEKLKYPVPFYTPKGAPSTDKHALEKLVDDGYEVAVLLKKYSEVDTLLSGFIDSIPRLLDKDGRLRGSLNSLGTASGRMASSSPNLQNMPNSDKYPVRESFVPKEGCVFICYDYKQLEPTILAHVTGDPELIKIYTEGGDIYQGIADAIGITRKQAKVLVLAIMYGMGADSMSKSLSIPVEEAKLFIEDFYKRFSKVKAWKTKIEKLAEKNLFSETMFGRKRNLHHLTRSKYEFFSAMRQAVNSTIQGSAADLVKITMIAIHKHFMTKYGEDFTLLQVHDEVLFEVPIDIVKQVAEEIQDIAENLLELSVPIRVDLKICANWASMKRDHVPSLDIMSIINPGVTSPILHKVSRKDYFIPLFV